VTLQWSAPPECPTAENVREAIDRNLSRAEFGPALSSVVVEGSIADEPDGWRLHVSVALPSGSVERDVTSSDCTELAAAAGLIIAVALDPLRVVDTVEERVARAAVVARPTPIEPPREPEERPPNLIATEPPAAPPVRVIDIDLRAAAVAEFGSLSVLRGGVGIGVGVVGPRYRVDLAAQYWAPRGVRPFAAEPDAGVAVQQAGLGLRGCLTPRFGPVELSSCLGFEAGASWGRGIGIGRTRTTALPWAAAVLGPELSWTSRRRVGVFAGADAMLWVVRPRFHVQDLGIAAQTQWVGVRVIAGPSFRL
jgi:hypothetical protein